MRHFEEGDYRLIHIGGIMSECIFCGTENVVLYPVYNQVTDATKHVCADCAKKIAEIAEGIPDDDI